MHRIDNWINEGSGWIVESVDGKYVNISFYSPLVESTYIELPNRLKNSMKGLINIKNSDNKCFLWCHIRHLNLVERNSQRITEEDKEIVSKLDYEGINFPVSKKDYCKIEMQSKICINVFCNCCLQCFNSEKILMEHKKDCLVINGKQSVKLKSSSIRFKNYSKQIHVPFKIYADFECILKKVACDIIECNSIVCNSNISYTRKYQDHILCSCVYKVCLY